MQSSVRIGTILSWVLTTAAVSYFAYLQYLSYSRGKVREQLREQAIAESVSNLRAMIQRHHANSDWPRKLVGKSTLRSSPVLSAELQEYWIAEKPILFIGILKDIARNPDETYQIKIARQPVSSDATLLGSELLVDIKCDSDKTIPLLKLMKRPSRLSIFEDVAIVATINRVSSSIGRDTDGQPNTILIGLGECNDVLSLPYTLPTDWLAKQPRQ